MKSEWIRVIRTVIQVLIPTIAAAPLIVDKLGIDKTAGVGAGVVVAAGVLTRLMAVPQFDSLINQFLGKGAIASAEESQGQ